MSSKAIFLDRDDTLIEDPGYINNPDQVKLLDGVPEALIELKQMGYKLIVASNQSAVARGIVTEEVLGEIHSQLRELLAEKGAALDEIYYCPYHSEGIVPKYRKESEFRKPNPGMLLAAAKKMNINLEQSWAIGNSSSDVEAGLRAGCKTILIDNPSHTKKPDWGSPNPDYKAVNMKEAVNIIKKHGRSAREKTAHVKSQSTEKSNQVPNSNTNQHIHSERHEHLLSGILEQLKRMHRADMFDEFSITRVLAGVVQVVVLFCLLISIWLLMSPSKNDNSVLITLAFAMVLQTMALTFYIMQGRK